MLYQFTVFDFKRRRPTFQEELPELQMQVPIQGDSAKLKTLQAKLFIKKEKKRKTS